MDVIGAVKAGFGFLTKAADIVDQTVEDKDKANEIKANLQLAKDQLRIVELNTKTIPWVDALHKMGRQILNFITIVGIFLLLAFDKEISPQAMGAIGAGNAIYQFIKGKGR